ncbi:MAG: PAS domain S-box protein [Burkholderiales bacterium]|nr:PAS domain S-box protein [Burkholderiales bacterium]
MNDVSAPAFGPDPARALAASATALLETIDSAVTVWDGALRCLYVNASAARMLGCPAQELPGRPLAEVIGEERFRACEAERAAVLAGRTVEFESQVQGGDGLRTCRIRLLPRRHGDGRQDGFIALTDDVTEARELRESRARRHETELAIERSNDALRMLYEQTPAMLHSIDTEGRLLTVSDRWLACLGYGRDEVLGRASVDFMTPGSREAVLVEYLPRLWRAGRYDRLSLQMVRRDGTVIDVLLSSVVGRDPEGRPLRALSVIEDVTTLLDRAAQLRREQLARRELERQAAELARLASERREMLDLLAHEVRQPLNNASAAIESAGAMLADKGEQGASARLVRAQGVLSEVRRHVDNTLAVSTLLSGAPSPPEEEADIDTVLSVALAELPRAERARITITRDTAARSALMDSALVRLALRNLLGNAIRHTAPGTPVTVRISDSEAPLALFIDIIDEGGGLPPELLPRLFARGARVRHPDGRTSHGLGLFIAHRALEVQGGELRLLHSGADGTALRLVLPQGQAG